jgi:hypothetical protein
MDVLAAGFVLGAGATWLAHRRRFRVRDAVAWTARQAGLISGQVSARVAEARRIAREQYETGRVIAGSGAASTSVRDGVHPAGDGAAARNGTPTRDSKSHDEHDGPAG